MRIDQLRCLVDIAETHSISSTAQRLYMSQQAVSKSMKQLEEELGTEFLVRTNVGVQLTEAGEGILEHAKQVLQAEQEIKKYCKAQSTKPKEMIEIKICSTSSVTNIVLPDIVADLNNKQENINLKIDLTNDLYNLFNQVQDGSCDLGILTYNEKAFQEKFKTWQDELNMEILAMDELVVVTDKKYLKGKNDFFPQEEFFKHIRTLYNILSVDEVRESTIQYTMVTSNDAEFHRRMIEKVGAVVMMPGLAYQYFFNSKKYIGLPLENYQVPLIQAAIYRKDADVRILDFIAMIRRELYIK